MILVAGLSPAWQQTLRFEALRLGEVNRAVEACWSASGKVLNVGIALAHLQVPSHTLSIVGGWAREPIEAEFRAAHASATWITTAAPTRVCTTVLDAATRQTTELVQNAPPVTAAELQAFCDAFARLAPQAQCVVITGSMPARTPPTFWHDLLRDVHVPVVLDIRGPELLAMLPLHPAVIKPNREELAQTVGRPLDDDAVLGEAIWLMQSRGAKSVVVTQGSKALWVGEADRVGRLEPPRVEQVINPIGCGDCLTAGLAWGLHEGQSLLDAVKLGMACAAQNVAQLLPGRLDAPAARTLVASIAPLPANR